MKGERITCKDAYGDHWVCICGNKPPEDGFYPCDTEGNEVEPTVKDWTTNWYVCQRCGRLIDQDTLEVVGMRSLTATKMY